MPFPIQPISDRISYLLDRELNYSPLDEFILNDKLRNLQWKFLEAPMFISFTPLNSIRTIEVKGILDYSEVYKPQSGMRKQDVNIIFLQFKGDKLIQLNGDKEKEVQLDNSNIFTIEDEVYTSLFLLDGTRSEIAKINHEACGILNRFGNFTTYVPEMKLK